MDNVFFIKKIILIYIKYKQQTIYEEKYEKNVIKIK